VDDAVSSSPQTAGKEARKCAKDVGATLDGSALRPRRAGARLNLRVPKARLLSGGSTLCLDATSG
jgi:hypothetical protein